jgi:hypothetical protein
MKRIILSFLILSILFVILISSYETFNSITYKEADLLDMPKLKTMYDNGKNETYPNGLGGWCSQTPEFSYLEIFNEWNKYKTKFGENITVSISLDDNGNYESLAIAMIEEDTIYFKSVMWDFNIPEDKWLNIIHNHMLKIADWGQKKGIKTMSSDATSDTWIYNYIRVILNDTGKLYEKRDGYYQIRIEDFKNLRVNYSRKLDYKPIATKEAEKPFVLPKDAKKINNWTYKVGNHSTYYVYPLSDLYINTISSNTGDNWLFYIDLSGVTLESGYEVENATLQLYFWNINGVRTTRIYTLNTTYWNQTSYNCSQLNAVYGSIYENITSVSTGNAIGYKYFNFTGNTQGVKYAVENNFNNITLQFYWIGGYYWNGTSNWCDYVHGTTVTLPSRIGSGKSVSANASESGIAVPILIINTKPKLTVNTNECFFYKLGYFNIYFGGVKSDCPIIFRKLGYG